MKLMRSICRNDEKLKQAVTLTDDERHDDEMRCQVMNCMERISVGLRRCVLHGIPAAATRNYECGAG